MSTWGVTLSPSALCIQCNFAGCNDFAMPKDMGCEAHTQQQLYAPLHRLFEGLAGKRMGEPSL